MKIKLHEVKMRVKKVIITFVTIVFFVKFSWDILLLLSALILGCFCRVKSSHQRFSVKKMFLKIFQIS